MPKKKRKPRKPHRRGPAFHGPPRSTAPRPEPPSGLLLDVRRVLQEDHPLGLLTMVSGLLAVVDPRARDPFHPDEDGPTLPLLLRSFIDVREPETTALLAALAELTTDESVAEAARREVARRRDHLLPAWLRDLMPLEIASTARQSHVLGDGDNVLVEARTAAGHALTAVVYVDHNLGTVAKDGFVLAEPLRAVADSFLDASGGDPDLRMEGIDPADARARISEAVDDGARMYPPLETDSWPVARPLVEWLIRHLPTGGRGHEHPEWSEEERADLARRFLASPLGDGLDDEDADLLDALLWYGCDYGTGDPLRWSPPRVELLLLDWLPRKIIADEDYLSRAPEVLRRFVAFAHGEAGIGAHLTDEVLAAIDHHAPEYAEIIGSDRPQGVAAILAGMGVDVDDEMRRVLAEVPTMAEQRQRILEESVGTDAVDHLDDAPLPDEALDLSGVPADVHARVREVAALIDGACDALLDAEHRTACRRLLRDVAAGDPGIFRRRGRPETAASAILWIVAKANGSLGQGAGDLTAKAIGEHLGVGTNPGQRAPTLLQAIGRPPLPGYRMHLGTTRYLVAAHRRRLRELRDQDGHRGHDAPAGARRPGDR